MKLRSKQGLLRDNFRAYFSAFYNFENFFSRYYNQMRELERKVMEEEDEDDDESAAAVKKQKTALVKIPYHGPLAIPESHSTMREDVRRNTMYRTSEVMYEESKSILKFQLQIMKDGYLWEYPASHTMRFQEGGKTLDDLLASSGAQLAEVSEVEKLDQGRGQGRA